MLKAFWDFFFFIKSFKTNLDIQVQDLVLRSFEKTKSPFVFFFENKRVLLDK